MKIFSRLTRNVSEATITGVAKDAVRLGIIDIQVAIRREEIAVPVVVKVGQPAAPTTPSPAEREYVARRAGILEVFSIDVAKQLKRLPFQSGHDDIRPAVAVVIPEIGSHARDVTSVAAAFPNTAPANWKVFNVEAPLTGGHCRIDLKHEGTIGGYDWSFSEKEQNAYGPFIRVSNSYNRTSVFGIRFGLVRWACTNGMVDWHSSITIKVAHDVNEMEKSIEAKINEAKFRKVFDDFRGVLEPLHHSQVPERRFRPLMLSVLQIWKSGRMPENRERAWKCLEEYLDGVASRYVKEMGPTGYALVNAITDVATHPPMKVGGYNFIRRERDGLQRLAGIWLVDFSKIAQQPQSLEAYLENPSLQTLRSGTPGRT